MRGRHVPACAPRWVRAADDLAALARVAGEVDFPCIVKGAMGHEARSGGGHVTRRVDTPEQLMASGTAASGAGAGIPARLSPRAVATTSGAMSAVTAT